MTLIDIVLGHAQRIGDILQGTGLAEITNGENRAENGLKADVLPRRRRQLRLKKTLVGIFLDIDQIRNIDNPLNFSEMFPQKLVIRDRISHGISFR